jgi:hypothetical protein
VNPLTNEHLAADTHARHLQAAAHHRLARGCRRPDPDRPVPGLSAALGRTLILIGWRLLDRAATRANRRTWAAG